MSFMYSSHLSRHVTIHGEPKWKCGICNFYFARKDTMMRHQDTHEKERHVFHCERCPKTYIYFESLKQHVKEKHTKNPTDFGCNVWKKKFVSKKTLTYHLNVHASLTPFESPICKQKCHQPYEKSRH